MEAAMRLIMFVISLTISACVFVWKMETISGQSQATAGNGGTVLSGGLPTGANDPTLFTQFMDSAMALMPGGGSAMGDPSNGGIGALGQMPDSQAIASQIEAQLKNTDFGHSGGRMAPKPKDFSARFVKARPSP
jgi:hypothetical protein